MKKINKEFVLSDSTLNTYSYRLLTSGYDLQAFKRNPVGYYMHQREEGVVLRWEDLTIKGDCIVGKPVINLDHPRGEQTIREVENGFLNAASVGHIVALEVSTNPADYLPGQTGPSISKWFNRECSLVDIPGNYNALTDTFNAKGENINLAGFRLCDLKTGGGGNIPANKIGKDVNTLLSEAIAEGEISVEVSVTLKQQFDGDPAGLIRFLEMLAKNKVEQLKALSWDYLDRNNHLLYLKSRDFEGFKAKFKEHFGKEYLSY